MSKVEPDPKATAGDKPAPKPRPSTKISGGTSFDPKELEAASAASVKKPVKSGTSVVNGRDKEIALTLLSKLCRAMHPLDLFDEFNASLSQMIRRVKELK